MKMTCDGVKLSDKLGDDTNQLKKDVVSELQRGFSTEMQYTDIARNISALGQASMARAMRIARTEGGRIQCKADLDCAYRARDLGCDTVKQWNATLDAKTRSSHQQVDKEWKELDEKFSNGLMYPGDPNGSASEVCNCRCTLDDVPRWYVESGGAKLRRNNETGEIIECENFAEFKEKYLKTLQNGVTIRKDNKTVRQWYVDNCNEIINRIDNAASVEQQAKEAFLLRNFYKIQARYMMSDRKRAKELMDERPLKSFDELLKDKMKRKGLTKEDAVADILKTATKTNRDVNNSFGL